MDEQAFGDLKNKIGLPVKWQQAMDQTWAGQRPPDLIALPHDQIGGLRPMPVGRSARFFESSARLFSPNGEVDFWL